MARTGSVGQGPALLPENLGRLMGHRERPPSSPRAGAATQMPGFGTKLDKDEIAALAAYIAKPLPQIPAWKTAEIAASRVIHAMARALDFGCASRPIR